MEEKIVLSSLKQKNFERRMKNMGEKFNLPAMLGRIVYLETEKILIKILPCNNKIGVASQISSIGGGSNGQ